jgi:hypothetical protein
MSLMVQTPEALVKRKLFLQKGDYKPCHILLNDTQERLAAIAVGQNLYSFFRTLSDREKALDLLGKLYDKGQDAVIVQAPKAYAIWVLETDASIVQRQTPSLTTPSLTMPRPDLGTQQIPRTIAG